MIGKGTSSLKRKMKGTTDGNSPTIERRPVVTGNRMGRQRHVLPDHGRARPNRQRRRGEAKAPIAIVGNQHDLCVARGRSRRWLSDGGCRVRRLNKGRRCWCRSRACAGRGCTAAAPTGGEQ